MIIYDGGVYHYPNRVPIYQLEGERFNRSEFEREVRQRWPHASEVTVYNVTCMEDDQDVFYLVSVE